MQSRLRQAGFEAYVRGIWLLRCASESELDEFQKDDTIRKKFHQLIGDIEKVEGYNVRVLSHMKQVSWRTMNSLTHSGMQQIARRNKGAEITPNYTDDEILDGMSTANALGFLTAVAIVSVADRSDLARELLKRQIEFFKE